MILHNLKQSRAILIPKALHPMRNSDPDKRRKNPSQLPYAVQKKGQTRFACPDVKAIDYGVPNQ